MYVFVGFSFRYMSEIKTNTKTKNKKTTQCCPSLIKDWQLSNKNVLILGICRVFFYWYNVLLLKVYTFYIYKLLHACSCVFRNSVCLKDNKFLVIKNKWTIEQDGCFEAESKHSFSLNIPDQICEFLIFLIEVSSDSDGPSPFSITFVISIILLECKWQTKEFGKTLRFESDKLRNENKSRGSSRPYGNYFQSTALLVIIPWKMKSNMQLSLLIENLENVSQNGIAQVVLQICHILSESHWIMICIFHISCHITQLAALM